MLKKLLILGVLAAVGALVAKKLLGGSQPDEWEDIEAWEAPQYPPTPVPDSPAAETATSDDETK